tara:strand:- start:681 stop:1139 length:459 start_codon:yes stop_codon:yes gene_type:complete
MKTFKIGYKNFTYPVESGVGVIQLKNKMYYVFFSPWIAKTLIEWQHMVNTDHIVKVNMPFKFKEKYLWQPNYHARFNTPEGRILKTQSIKAFTDGVYFAYCERYGTDKVRSADHTYFGEVKMEHKTKAIEEKLNVFPYDELYMEANDERANS